MSTQVSEQSIKALFEAAEAPLGDETFTMSVVTEAQHLKRRVWIRRALVGVLIFLASIPFSDYIVSMSQLLLISLVEIPEGLFAELLAPVNSVGGLISVVLLSVRKFYKKLFHR